MKKNEKKTVLAKALTSVADGMLSKAANSRCALIYHQPKQPEEVRKFRKNKKMRKVAKLLTDYVIKKSMVDEADREVYEYGFVITLEVGLFLVASLFIALKLDMVLEGIFFFVIFSPLRSYAGGLHLEKFWICFVLSCLTYITTLLVVKNLCLHEFVSLIVLFALEVFVYVLYPVENRNREINEEENKCFKIKLMKYLCLDFFIGIVCTIFEKDSYFLELNIIFLIVVITMLIGKCRNHLKNVCKSYVPGKGLW